MEAKRKWATAVVVIVALAFGGGGAVYLYREAFPADPDATRDGGLAGDASADAKAGRGKPKVAKRGGRPGKPRGAAPKPIAQNGGPQSAGGSAPSGPSDDSQQNDDSTDEETAPEFHAPFRGRGPAGPTYESAIASNNQQMTMGEKYAPDLTDAQLAGPMRNGAFVGECGAPDSTKVTVKVAIKQGRPVGVSVSTSPPDPDVAGCIDRYVRTFSWPSNARMDSFTTTY